MRAFPLAAIILLLAVSATGAEQLSAGKVSLHLIARYTPGAREVIEAGPPVLKVLDLGSEMMDAVRDYKARWPQGKTVLRIYTRKAYERDADAAEAGRDFWETVLAPPLSRLSPEDRRLIDYVEGPNECEHYPVWETPETAAWYGEFWRALAPLIAGAGFKPCVGSIPVGNPPGTPAEMAARMLACAPGLLAANAVGGAWSYHAYSLAYTTDVAQESWTSLRYRMLHDMVTKQYPELASMPVILTEAGIDYRGNPEKDGWQGRGDAAKFRAWLQWFDSELRKDPYLLGATLFQCGDARGWPSFETEPVNGWLATYLRNQTR